MEETSSAPLCIISFNALSTKAVASITFRSSMRFTNSTPAVLGLDSKHGNVATESKTMLLEFGNKNSNKNIVSISLYC